MFPEACHDSLVLYRFLGCVLLAWLAHRNQLLWPVLFLFLTFDISCVVCVCLEIDVVLNLFEYFL